VVLATPQDASTRPFQDITAPSGDFEFKALQEGLHIFFASGSSREGETMESDPIAIVVKESPAGTQRVELVLRKLKTLHGRVVSSFGPVPNASVLAVPLDGSFAVTSDIHTNLRGEFELALRESSAMLTMSAWAPGYAFRVFRLRANPDAPIEVHLSQIGGTLFVDGAESNDGQVGPGTFLIRGDHSWIPLTQVLQWAQSNGGGFSDAGTLIVPQMEQGSYRLCSGSLDVLLAGQGNTCSEGTLLAGSELRLTTVGNGGRQRN
jgi:hypothetical protein